MDADVLVGLSESVGPRVFCTTSSILTQLNPAIRCFTLLGNRSARSQYLQWVAFGTGQYQTEPSILRLIGVVLPLSWLLRGDNDRLMEKANPESPLRPRQHQQHPSTGSRASRHRPHSSPSLKSPSDDGWAGRALDGGVGCPLGWCLNLKHAPRFTKLLFSGLGSRTRRFSAQRCHATEHLCW